MWRAARMGVAGVALALLAGCMAGPVLPLQSGEADAPSLACPDPCPIVVDASPGGGWEPHVAIHPHDPMHVVVATRPQDVGAHPASYVLWFDLHVTTDGGRTWNVTSLRYTEPLGGSADPDAPNVMGDPVLAFLPDGTLLVTGATLRVVAVPGGVLLSEVRLVVARSPDGGRHVEEPAVVARSEGVLVAAGLPGPVPAVETGVLLRLPDKPWLATGPDGTALLTWTDIAYLHPDDPTAARSDIVFSVSRDGGRTWSAPGFVARGAVFQGSAPVVGSDGAWHVAFADWDAREARVTTSRDQGATWRGRAVAGSAWMPSLAVSREAWGDRLLLVTPLPEGGGFADDVRQAPALAWSDDGGETWAAPVRLDEPEAPGRALPSVAAGPDGVAYVTFAHAKGEGAAATAEFRAVATRPGEWVADLALDADVAGPTSRMGDYLGLAAGPAGAFAVWSTTADGREYDVVGAWLRAAGPAG